MKGTIEERLLKALANRTRSASTDVLASKIRAEKTSTASQLSKMTKSGIVTRTGPGKWKLVVADTSSNTTPDEPVSKPEDTPVNKEAFVTITLSRDDTVLITSVLESILETLQNAIGAEQKAPRRTPELRVVS